MNFLLIVGGISLFLQLAMTGTGLAHSIVVEPHMPGVAIGSQLLLLTDVDAQKTIEELSRLPDTEFILSKEKVPSFGFTRAAIWAKFTIHNPKDQPMPLVLEYGYANADFVDFYWPDPQGGFHKMESGDQRPNHIKSINYRLSVFEVQAPPGTTSYFLRCRTEGVTQFPLRLWDHRSFNDKRTNETGFLGIFYGFLLVMVFYNSFLAINFRNSGSILYIGFIISAIGLQFGYQGLYGVLFPETLAPWLANVGFLSCAGFTIFFATSFSIHFLNLRRHLPGLAKILMAMGVLGLAVPFIASWNYEWGGKIANTSAAITALIVITAGIISCYKRYRPAYFYTSAWLMTAIGFLVNPLSLMGLIPSNLFTTWATFIGIATEVVLISLALGDKMRLIQDKYRATILALNEGLETEVENKTRDIVSILKSIRQGIFTIHSPELTIDQQYSEFLREMTGCQHIAGNTLRSLLLDRTELSENEKSIIESCIAATLGEDIISFELNESNFIQELIYLHPEKSLARNFMMDWSPIVDSQQRVTKLLICIRDVTELHALKIKTMAQEGDMRMILDLVHIPESEYQRFHRNTLDDIHGCCDLIELEQMSRNDILRHTFMKLHTIKGASRSFRLQQIATSCHDTEHMLAKILHKPDLWDKHHLLQDLSQIEALLLRHLHLGEKFLGWQSHRKFVKMPKEHIEIMLDHVKALYRPQIDTAEHQHLEAIENILVRDCYASLLKVVEGVCRGIDSTARDLQKAVPLVDIQCSSHIILRDKGADLLNAVLLHLVRNSVDHGLENTERRRHKQKAAQGLIKIEAHMDGSWLHLNYRDDGQGLNLTAIEQRAREQGLLNAQDTPDIAATAMLVFAPGLSTKREVSEISGRGIGLSAVQELLQAVGGTIEIILDPNPGVFEASFEYRIKIPTSLCLPAYFANMANLHHRYTPKSEAV